MKPYCESVVQVLLPAIRALITKELIEKYNLTQQDAAKRLGITQAAISQYRRDLRGSRTRILEKDKEITEEIGKFASRIVSGDLESALNSMEGICSICKIIRRKEILCKIHRESFIGLEECRICIE
ncbi:MAG: transcriptional regulator [Candidatus Aenigmatarchaeota archaeon]